MAARKRRKKRQLRKFLVPVIAAVGVLSGGYAYTENTAPQMNTKAPVLDWQQTVEQSKQRIERFFYEVFRDDAEKISVADIPEFAGSPFVEINGNVPEFKESDMTFTAYESYGNLDYLGRCTQAFANVGQELMPTGERESISEVTPTGWKNEKYDGIEGGYIYNRCHLIGYQLTGENANERNLITGTRYLNVTGMLPFENKIADFVEQTGYHVLYRVTPIFDGNNLVASGVQMEAKSVEDEGAGVQFNVYCYNVQPGYVIDYATGSNKKK